MHYKDKTKKKEKKIGYKIFGQKCFPANYWNLSENIITHYTSSGNKLMEFQNLLL